MSSGWGSPPGGRAPMVLIVSRGEFPTFSVAHRGNVVDDVVAHALGTSERFEILAAQVERMDQRELAPEERIRFAEQALTLRYPEPAEAGMAASVLLSCRRGEDAGEGLWRTLNPVQENFLRGGLPATLSQRTPTADPADHLDPGGRAVQ